MQILVGKSDACFPTEAAECQDVAVTDAPIAAPKRDVGLCLSGGGYRAAVFHLGSLIRLNEAGLLPRLRTVSSVSGGSIVAAFLGLRWTQLQFGPEGRAANLHS